MTKNGTAPSQPPVLAGWSAETREDGVVLSPPGASGASLTLRPRVSPLVGMLRLAELALEELGIAQAAPSALQRVAHAQGELALYGELAAGPIRIGVGAVFGEEHLVSAIGVARDPSWAEIRGALLAILPHLSLDLPPLRPRRALFRRPAGWTACPRGLATELHAPGHPKRLCVMTVMPARPAQVDAALTEHLFEQVGGFLVDDEVAHPLSLPSGLSGVLEESIGRVSPEARPTILDRVTLEDRTFRYQLRLEAALGEAAPARRCLRELFESLRPISLSVPEADAPVSHWL